MGWFTWLCTPWGYIVIINECDFNSDLEHHNPLNCAFELLYTNLYTYVLYTNLVYTYTCEFVHINYEYIIHVSQRTLLKYQNHCNLFRIINLN